MVQTVKSLNTMQETWVRSPGQKDLQEKGMATHSSIFAWRIPWTEEPGGLQSNQISKSQTRLSKTKQYVWLELQYKLGSAEI